MSAIFLSASVPVGLESIWDSYHETADPFLIQSAVREFVTVALGRRLIVWGGHPAITPMVWAVCQDLGVSFAKAVVLYQSRFFEDTFPEENQRFGNVEYVDAVPDDREASLLRMRQAMLSRADLAAAVFIGGKRGLLMEHILFTEYHPGAKVLVVPAAGGAARVLASRLGIVHDAALHNLDFAKYFHVELSVAPDEPRSQGLHQGEEAVMAKKKVFISFDFDNDKPLRDFMKLEAERADSPFEVVDHSLKEAASEKDWLDEATTAIKRADVFIVMLGHKTKEAPGVLKEVKIANQLKKRKFQIIGYSDGSEDWAVPDGGLTYGWSWENLKKLFS